MQQGRRCTIAVAAACGLLVSGCGSTGSPSGTPTTEIPITEVPITVAPTTEVPTTETPTTHVAEVPITEVAEGVEFYPACGNEVLDHLGVTWFTLIPVGGSAIDAGLNERARAILDVARQPSPVAGRHGLARVTAPGPGDDVGTLVVWADGVARFVSDSGDLDVWLIDEPITYSWAC